MNSEPTMNFRNSTVIDQLIGATLFFTFAILIGCDSATPDPDAGEQELITRVVLQLETGGQTIMAAANDPDGDGLGFQIDTLRLAPGVSYTGSIGLFDDVNGETITEEVSEESDEHQFFYTVGGQIGNRVSVTITDQDSNGLPVGLLFTITDSASTPSEGTLRVVLSHYDDGPKNGTDRSDETDVDVVFPVVVQ